MRDRDAHVLGGQRLQGHLERLAIDRLRFVEALRVRELGDQFALDQRIALQVLELGEGGLGLSFLLGHHEEDLGHVADWRA